MDRLIGGRRAAIFLVIASVAPAAPAQTFTTLANFYGANGAGPLGALVQGTDGNFYSTTVWNGPTSTYQGTVFKMTPAGRLSTVHAFTGPDGASPRAGLLLAADGNLYGTTSAGGINGNGTVFVIRGDQLTTLHNFQLSDGFNPQASMIQASSGDLYGSTYESFDGGGIGSYGTLFKMTPAGALTTIHSFVGADGSNPNALVQAINGDFYGTTQNLGTGGLGTMFRITPNGSLTTLYGFAGFDGANPFDTVIQATDGSFYGSTGAGGTSACYNGCGTIFRITPDGTLTTLYSFGGFDGSNPYSALVQATDGYFYGTTYYGGSGSTCYAGCGTLFRIASNGTLTTLHNFVGADGANPNGAMIQGTDGNLYGTTDSGGPYGHEGAGTVFRLSVGLAPFVKVLPTSGKVGTTVRILGTNLTGATAVTFNDGIVAAFTVVRASEITAIVPAGATTGTVQVVTPNGRLSSNVAFQVKP